MYLIFVQGKQTLHPPIWQSIGVLPRTAIKDNY
jgi:hypothetical protein